MSRFIRLDGEISADLEDIEVGILRLVPPLLAGVGEPGVDRGADRLRYEVHADDPERSAEFRRLASDLVDGGRAADIAALVESIDAVADGAALSDDAAAGWVGAINQARVVLAARLGIDDDGWGEGPELAGGDPSRVMLLLLSFIQTDLVDVLEDALD